jgi:hypothetical protein
MPCWLGLFPPSPVSPLLSSLSPILRHGTFFYLLWFLWGTICAHIDKGCGADSEHMETNTKSDKYLPLYDLDRNDSESDILYYDIFIPMWSHPLEVSLIYVSLNLALIRSFSLVYLFATGES